MSKETLEWLNSQTLIGFTTKRGNAWHYQESMQGAEPNHYPEAIPIADVQRRLFGWKAVSEPIYVVGSDGGYIEVAGRQAILADDSRDVLGIFKEGYQPHQYSEWLLDNVASILDANLGIGSAGLLRNRGQAWVSVEVPDSIQTPQGITFRPNLVACTSFDGTLATTYKRTVTNVVCDNTLSAGLGESGQSFKAKHTRNSGMRIASAREALAIVFTIADDFAAEVERLSQWEISTEDFTKHLSIMVPVVDGTGEPLEKRALTLAENKREILNNLYMHDDRCAPWNGTALGVLQTYNTYAHHFQTVRGGSRVQRNRELALSGKLADMDAEVMDALAKVTT